MADVERTVLVGLIGAGIGRSLSPAMHETEARYHGIRLQYQLIELDQIADGAAALPRLIDVVAQQGFAGVNITFPCKQTVIPLLDELSESARAMGAVNTVVFRDNKKIGHNTDGPGWAWAFQRAMPNADLSRVVLLGAGGAGSAIAHAALRLGVKQLTIVDAEAQRAVDLAKNLNARFVQHIAASDDLAATMCRACGLIHATPTGMEKYPGMPLPLELLRPELWISEVVYFPIETEFLRTASALGCTTMDGGGMAVGQAIRAFELFTGIAPDAVRMEQHFRAMIAEVLEK
jgi:shikimate dehydrogenase